MNGECQLGIRRDADRSTISWFASVSQQKSPYTSSPNAAATAVRSPSRDAATAMFATPPGQDPIPWALTSVPLAGGELNPVSTMSKKTVPLNAKSMAGPPLSRVSFNTSFGSPPEEWTRVFRTGMSALGGPLLRPRPSALPAYLVLKP